MVSRTRFRLGATATAVATLVVTLAGPVRPAAAEPVWPAEPAALRTALLPYLPAGTAARIDPGTHAVVLRLSGAAPAPVAALARHRPDRLRVEAGTPLGLLSGVVGGHEIDTHNGRQCTAGFIVADAAQDYLVTAGHCADGEHYWWRNGKRLGEVVDYVNGPDGDFGLIMLNHSFSGEPLITDYHTALTVIDSAKIPPSLAGIRLCKSGRTTRLTCGSVRSVDVTIHVSEGYDIGGLIETDICAQPGDSGGPLFGYADPPTSVYAVGITSAGSLTSCGDPGFRSYYQPIDEALAYFGVDLMTG
jgi:hypothetical protein